MIDGEGFRPNVGIILLNARDDVFWAQRVRRDHGWQFPQGGIDCGESPVDAMYRELREEIGLFPHHVQLVSRTKDWLHYEVPGHLIRPRGNDRFRGQKQIWFLLRMTGCDSDICLATTSHPEFGRWRWCQYWEPLVNVIDFKRDVYTAALKELSTYVQLPST